MSLMRQPFQDLSAPGVNGLWKINTVFNTEILSPVSGLGDWWEILPHALHVGLHSVGAFRALSGRFFLRFYLFKEHQLVAIYRNKMSIVGYRPTWSERILSRFTRSWTPFHRFPVASQLHKNTVWFLKLSMCRKTPYVTIFVYRC